MAQDGDDPRFVGGPRPLGALIPRIARPAFKRRSPAGAQLMADWPAVVGPAIAAVTAPQRLSAGTLTIRCAGPVAMELTHLAPELLGRINAHLGRLAVERLRFVQVAAPAPAGPHPAAPARGGDAPLPPGVEARLAALPEGDLKAALAKLARGVYRSR